MRAPFSRLGLLSTAAILAGRAAAGPAPDPFARCEARVRASPSDREAWRCFEVEGQAPSRYEEAKRRLESRRTAMPGNPFSLLALGRLEAGRGVERAEGILSSASEGFARLGDDAGRAQALAARARFLGYRKRTAEAQAAASELRVLAERSHGPEARLELGVAEAGLSQFAGDYGRAWTLLRGVEDDVLAHGHSVLRRGWLSTFAYVGWATGRSSEAVTAYRRLASMLHEEQDRYREAGVLTDLVGVLTVPGIAGPVERRQAAEEALEAARGSGNLVAEAAALDYLADFDGPGTASAAAVARALELARASGDPRSVAMALRAQALYGDAPAAEAAYQEALAAAGASGNGDDRARILVVRSRMLWAAGPRDAAIAASVAAMDAAEVTRDRPPDGVTRARRFGQWGRVYKELAGHLLEDDLLPAGPRPSAEDLELAFATLERMRARVLLDEMDAAGVPVDPAAAPARGAFPSLAEIRAGLPPDEALLVYTLADAGPSDGPSWGATSRVLAVTRNGTSVRPVPDNLSARDPVALFTGLLDARRGDEAGGAARLYSDYVKPAFDALPSGIKRLVVVPDRILFHVPFAALRAPAGGPSFGEAFEISVVPSATIWWRERKRPDRSAPKAVLAFVDAGSGAGGASLAPERAAGFAGLPPLLFARREGGAAVERVGLGSRLLVGAGNAETTLEAAGPADYRVLHFAAHVLLDDAHPDRSAIVLTPGRTGEDGLLHLREIAALKLPGSVVVVSGCRSAGGLVLGGEGPMGLARAFFLAGARAVVGSLRPLRDDEAAAFFDRFYAHLARGASVAGAVRLAQIDRRKAGAPAAAWAGIVTLGDGSSVPFPRGGSRWPWLTAAVFLAAAVLWFLRFRLFR